MATGEFMSAIQTNNDSKTVFNLYFDNGLPYKPVIRGRTEIYQRKDTGSAFVKIYVETNKVMPTHDFFEGQRVLVDEYEIFIDLGDSYLVGSHSSKLVLDSAKNKNLIVKVHQGDVCIAGIAV